MAKQEILDYNLKTLADLPARCLEKLHCIFFRFDDGSEMLLTDIADFSSSEYSDGSFDHKIDLEYDVPRIYQSFLCEEKFDMKIIYEVENVNDNNFSLSSFIYRAKVIRYQRNPFERECVSISIEDSGDDNE